MEKKRWSPKQKYKKNIMQLLLVIYLHSDNKVLIMKDLCLKPNTQNDQLKICYCKIVLKGIK